MRQSCGKQRDHQAVFDGFIERVVAEGHTLDIVLQSHEGVACGKGKRIKVNSGVGLERVDQNDEDRVEIRNGNDRKHDRQDGMRTALFLEAGIFHY